MKKSTKQLAAGTALAAGIGYLAGILTAPKSGKETRKDIKDTAVKARAEAEKKLKSANQELTKLLQQARDRLKTVRSKSKDGLTQAIERAEKAQTKTRNILSALHEGDNEDHDLQSAAKEVKDALDHLKKYLDDVKKEK